MASIFTFNIDPPKLSSPWPICPGLQKPPATKSLDQDSYTDLVHYGITKLMPEPQDGPLEYKLHLLLRPRRHYDSYSVGRGLLETSEQKRPAFGSGGINSMPSSESRQKRFEQLTTQLLWRLQQSSPNHSTSIDEIVLPKLADATLNSTISVRPGKLIAGLEESHGALYEVGVSDDGNFVGLTDDELQESLKNLRLMAASIGCDVKITQLVVVGSCEWISSATQLLEKDASNFSSEPPSSHAQRQFANLYVAEAHVSPCLTSRNINNFNLQSANARDEIHSSLSTDKESQKTAQLRCTIIGPSNSGKSSLLGNLCTATLDNGRGKIRVSLLKHRHEIKSGVTSSVAQELIGYKDLKVVNYASANVNSWIDIHAAAHNERLVFFSDCPGLSKHHKTTFRGLIGWAPHWNFLCVAADSNEDNDSETSGSTSSTASIFLELCLRANTPFAVVITKLDLASKSSLKKTLSWILSALKAAERVPKTIPPENSRAVAENELAVIPQSDDDFVKELTKEISTQGSMKSIVPIAFTSAVTGVGIRSLHALLRRLPIPPTPEFSDRMSSMLRCLFHIEDTYSFPSLNNGLNSESNSGIIISGHLRSGKLFVGHEVLIGPLTIEADEANLQRTKKGEARDLSRHKLAHDSPRPQHVSARNGEWLAARVVSIRNLRLPVHVLEPGQVGTIGIVLSTAENPQIKISTTFPRVRKGMILAIPEQDLSGNHCSLQAVRRFEATFDDDENLHGISVGSLAILYMASIKASACIRQIQSRLTRDLISEHPNSGLGLAAAQESSRNFEELPSDEAPNVSIVIAFELVTSPEWIELASPVVMMPRSQQGPGSRSEKDARGGVGQMGFVGRVIRVGDA